MGPRPVRRLQPGRGQCGLTLIRRQRGHRGDGGVDLGAQMLHRAQVDVEGAAHALPGQFHDAPQPARPAAEELRNPVCATQVQMGVVLPGDTDAAEHLDAVLGVGLRGLDAGGRGDRGGDGKLRICVPGGGLSGISRGHRDLLGAQQHLGAHVLDRLEAADRLAELFAHLRVLDGRVQCPPGQSGGLGGQHRRRQILDPLRWRRQRRRRRIVEDDAGQRSREVRRRERFDGDPVGRRVDQQPAVGTRQQHHAAGYRAQHVPGHTGNPVVGDTQVGRQGEAGRAFTGHQRLEYGRVVDHQRRQGARRHRSGNQRGRRLFDHRAQVGDGRAGAAGLLRNRDTEQSQFRKPDVDGPPGLRLAVLDVAGRGDPAGSRGPGSHQLACGGLLGSDGPRDS